MLGCLEIWIDSVSGRLSNDHVTAILKKSTNQTKIAADMAANTADMALTATKEMKAEMGKLNNAIDNEKKNRNSDVTTINATLQQLQEQDKNILRELEQIKHFVANCHKLSFKTRKNEETPNLKNSRGAIGFGCKNSSNHIM